MDDDTLAKAGEGAGTRLWQQGSLDHMTGWKQKPPESFALLPPGQRGPVGARATPGSAAMAFSRSTDEIHSPPLLMRSFDRSRMMR